MCDCCQQAEKTEHDRVEELLDVLERKPDTDLPEFCEALKASGQSHIVDILKKIGLNAHAAIIILSQHENRDICVARTCVCTKMSTFIQHIFTSLHISAPFS